MDLNEYLSLPTKVEELDKKVEMILSYQKSGNSKPDIGGIEIPIEVTGFSKARIYQLVSGDLIPHHKVEGLAKLFFLVMKSNTGSYIIGGSKMKHRVKLHKLINN